MKHGGNLLVCVLGLFAIGSARATAADALDNPYQEIISRNVFALKPPPEPAPPEEAKPPPVKITLTGITTVIGKCVLMKTPPPPSKPGSPPATEQFYALREGEREGDIEVLQIDEKAGSVRLRNAGIETMLTLEKDGVKLPTTAAPATTPTIPGMPPMPGGVIPPPPAVPTGIAPAATGVKPQFPVRPVRSGPQAGMGYDTKAYTYGGGNYSGGYVAPGAFQNVSAANSGIVLPGFNSASAAQSQSVPPSQIQLTPEEQIIALEAQRQVTANQVRSGKLPPLPPTPLTPPGAPGSVPIVPNPQPGTDHNN